MHPRKMFGNASGLFVCVDKSRRKKMTLDHPIFTRWPAQYPDRLQFFSAPTPNGVKAGIMLEETSLAYKPRGLDLALPCGGCAGPHLGLLRDTVLKPWEG